MAYFAREDRTRLNQNKSPPRRTGIAVGGARDVASQKAVPTREDLLDAAVNQMQPKGSDPSALGPMRFINDTEAKNRHGANPHRHVDNDIFGPPKLDPKPKARVRIGVTDEELNKIWHEDEAKYVAALKMEKGTNLVDKMIADPINPVMTSARSKDRQPPGRKQIEMLSETQVGRNITGNAPAGFAGMGGHTAEKKGAGVLCKPIEQFVAPDFIQKPRNEGRRTRFPPDTFSFQDDNQTHFE